mmetsp:Transcript_2895/g.8810  ORF Transcript_2895/g.8810 Transcript_2895/m.8810 type:complete len:145 (+) Transcript_2895:146-580(+)
MCRHIPNAQVAVRSACCRMWIDCAECHDAVANHEMRTANEMVFSCKTCGQTFRKVMSEFTTEDEFCPHCRNHFVLNAELENESEPQVSASGKRLVTLSANSISSSDGSYQPDSGGLSLPSPSKSPSKRSMSGSARSNNTMPPLL